MQLAAELLGGGSAEKGLVGRHAVVLGRGLGALLQHGSGRAGVLLQRRFGGIVHRVEELLLAGELHLGLGGVDVHVHAVQTGGQMEHAAGEPAHHLLVLVGLLQRRLHGAGLHIAAVDKEKLAGPGAPAADRLGEKAVHADVLSAALAGHEAQGYVPTQHGVDRALEAAVAGGVQLLLALPQEAEAHLRVAEGGVLDDGHDGAALGGVALQKLLAGGGVEKQIPDDEGGALGAADFLPLAHHATVQQQGGACGGALGAGHQLHPAHRRDGGQRLAPEAQRADGLQIKLGADLAGGMAQEGGQAVLRLDAGAVVRHPDVAHAAPLDLHRHCGGPGVNGVFRQLLHGAGRALHHLAGGNQIRHMGVELMYLGHKVPLSKSNDLV